MTKKSVKKPDEIKGIKLPEIPVGGRQPQYPINCYPITANDVVEVMARGITAYMNERLTKFHAIAYNPENIFLRKKTEQLEGDISALQAENNKLKRSQSMSEKIKALFREAEKGGDNGRD
jgi:hypothetical protein